MVPRFLALTATAAMLVLGSTGALAAEGAVGPPLITQVSTTQPTAEHADMAHACPMEVEGTEVAVADAPNGVALAFTNGAGGADELRSRVHHMVEIHNAHRQAGDSAMIVAEASVQDTEFGARLVLTPADASQLDALRTEVTQHAERMQAGGCPMMREHAPPDAGAQPEAETQPAEGTAPPETGQ